MAYIVEKQLTVWDLLGEQEDPEEKPFWTDERIDRCLCSGSGFSFGELRIYRQYEKGCTVAQNAEFLKHEYGTGGRCPASYSKQGDEMWHTSMDYNHAGLKLSRRHDGPEEIKEFSWVQVAERIQRLFDAGEYLTEKRCPCLTCIFEEDGRCQHISECSRDQRFWCSKGSFWISKESKCPECGRRHKLKNIQQVEIGSDFCRCPKCGTVVSYNNKGNRPTASELFEAGKLVGL